MNTPRLQTLEFETCNSTNALAWENLSADHPTLVISDTQSEGRGRQGRVWESGKPGNLYASYAFVPKSKTLMKNLNWLSLASGVAAADAIHETTVLSLDTKPLRLKWPNDIYLDQAKFGGLLCESRWSGSSCVGIVIGFGLNIVSSPQLEICTTSLCEAGVPFSTSLKSTLLQAWVRHLSKKFRILEENKTEEIRLSWLSWTKWNENITYSRLKTHPTSGVCVEEFEARDLTSEGKLEAKRYSTGEIVFLDQGL